MLFFFSFVRRLQGLGIRCLASTCGRIHAASKASFRGSQGYAMLRGSPRYATQRVPTVHYAQRVPMVCYAQRVPAVHYAMRVPTVCYTQRVPMVCCTQSDPMVCYTQRLQVQSPCFLSLTFPPPTHQQQHATNPFTVSFGSPPSSESFHVVLQIRALNGVPLVTMAYAARVCLRFCPQCWEPRRGIGCHRTKPYRHSSQDVC